MVVQDTWSHTVLGVLLQVGLPCLEHLLSCLLRSVSVCVPDAQVGDFGTGDRFLDLQNHHVRAGAIGKEPRLLYPMELGHTIPLFLKELQTGWIFVLLFSVYSYLN